MDGQYKNKLAEAQMILEMLKESLVEILWDDEKDQYNGSRHLIPWMQEDAEYAIKNIKLNEEDEIHYLKLIQRVVGEYTNDV